MTELEIKQTIKATQDVIQNKVGVRGRYTLALKSAIVAAARVVGPSQFSKQTGLSVGSLYRWANRSQHASDAIGTPQHLSPSQKQKKKTGRLESQPLTQSKLVRQIEIVPENVLSGCPSQGDSGIAALCVGDQLEIKISINSHSAEWVAQVIGSLKRLNGRGYA